MSKWTLFFADQRGVALPMAMLALIILSALIIGFSVLSATEPTIANNQLMMAQARALAESGIEQAIWALDNGADPKGISITPPFPASWAAPAPYDGSQLVLVATGGTNIGGFKVTVAAATTPPASYPPECPQPQTSLSGSELCIVARGYVPNDTATRQALQKIAVTVMNPQFLWKNPPAALSVRGELEAGGNSLVDSRADTSCGNKDGTLTTGVTYLKSGAEDIWGAGSEKPNLITNALGGAIPTTANDVVQNVATTLPSGTSGTAFDNYIWTDADINALRAYAKAHGTYLQGSVTFNAGNLIPNGVVFVDTVSGNNITQEGVIPATPSSDFGSVDIHGNPVADGSGIFSGILFVNGTLSIDGNFKMHGFAYAQNDVTYHGVGAGGVYGAVMSRNIRDTSSTSIDSDLLGNALINFNCAYAENGGGSLPPTWSIESGTYKELSGS